MRTLTVMRVSLSRDGRVEGEKFSFLSAVCFGMYSLFRMAVIRASAEPDIVNGPAALLKGTNLSFVTWKQNATASPLKRAFLC